MKHIQDILETDYIDLLQISLEQAVQTYKVLDGYCSKNGDYDLLEILDNIDKKDYFYDTLLIMKNENWKQEDINNAIENKKDILEHDILDLVLSLY